VLCSGRPLIRVVNPLRRSGLSGAARNANGYARLAAITVGALAVAGLMWQYERLRRRSQAIAAERRADRRLRMLLERASDIVAVIDEKGVIRWIADSARTVLGADVTGRKLATICHPDSAGNLEDALERVRLEGRRVTVEVQLLTSGGPADFEVVIDDQPVGAEVEGLLVSMRDVGDRLALQKQLRHQALHDALTGLANRTLLEDRMRLARARAARSGQSYGLLVIDIDHFKLFNDSLGHGAGDALLCELAKRIDAELRPADTAARLGGDAFAVLLEDGSGAQIVAERLRRVIAAPYHQGERTLHMTASIGVAYGDGGRTVEETLAEADLAMYASKDSGRNATRIFTTDLRERAMDRLELGAQLPAAIDRDELVLEYQPIVELSSDRVYGVEALVRWQHPQRGLLGPGQFVPLAEENGAIVALGDWVLRAALDQLAEWDRHPATAGLSISVNISAHQLDQDGFVARVAALLRHSHVDPARLLLELTESTVVADPGSAAHNLMALRELGVRLAVDDFGTGVSGLSQLRSFPLDVLKIDRSFVNGIEADAAKLDLVRGIIQLADTLDLAVVAEGIERPEQRDCLRALSTTYGQGYLFSRPLAPGQLARLLATGIAAV
jgi:diguanylate cyclase (GGDEF)-like protein/PAS domain S-box-containing protein